jgi:hypothetical protein
MILSILNEGDMKNIQQGKLTVTGKGNSTISLFGEPKDLYIKFIDMENLVPCNPHCHDILESEIKVSKLPWFKKIFSYIKHIIIGSPIITEEYKLVINWKVSGIQTIKWKALFFCD